VIGIVDYGLGNRRSVEKALEHVGAHVALTGDPAVLGAADGLVVPGVGAFPAGARALRERGLDAVITERARAGVPVIGLCLGMQLLFEGSDEHDGAEGLGLLRGWVRRLRAAGERLPHIGWNAVRWVGPSPLIEGLPQPAAFYHVHSYAPEPADAADVVGVSDHGGAFVAVVGRGNVMGAQFHPEKSSADGLALLANFVRTCEPAAVAA
jgi:glutamine amidotransferase